MTEQGSLTLQGNGSFSGGTANNPAGTIYLAIGNDKHQRDGNCQHDRNHIQLDRHQRH